MADNSSNPLFTPQREKKGAETYDDYSYQYHWALYRAVQEHKLLNEYAIFVELHEDVVLANSLTAKDAMFEFNQVKTTNKAYGESALCRLKNGKSVLGKLISSCSNKPFSSNISSINLVAVKGFGLKLKDKGVTLQKITLADIEDATVESLAKKINKEIGIEKLPVNLQFVIPDLSDIRYQDVVIAEISKLICVLFPGSYFNPVYIYQSLIDDLNRKGTVSYDFSKWNDLLNNKAVTSQKVQAVISEFINTKDEAKIEADFNQIASELKFKVIERRELKRHFDRYRQMRIGNRTIAQIETTKVITNILKTNERTSNGEFSKLLELVQADLPSDIVKCYSDPMHLKAVIICEYIYAE